MFGTALRLSLSVFYHLCLALVRAIELPRFFSSLEALEIQPGVGIGKSSKSEGHRIRTWDPPPKHSLNTESEIIFREVTRGKPG